MNSFEFETLEKTSRILLGKGYDVELAQSDKSEASYLKFSKEGTLGDVYRLRFANHSAVAYASKSDIEIDHGVYKDYESGKFSTELFFCEEWEGLEQSDDDVYEGDEEGLKVYLADEFAKTIDFFFTERLSRF